MNEDFLHYLWKFRMLENPLCTTAGQSVTVIHPGMHNRDSGPDFFNARVKFGETTWAGNVEVHIQASDWYRHNHQVDRAYENVILHVVYEDDAPVRDMNGNFIPTLSLKGKFSDLILDRYKELQKSLRWIPCEKLITEAEAGCFANWAPVLAIESQQEKMGRFSQILDCTRNDWEECFYRLLARAFGFRINALPFEQLASSLPLKIVRKYSSQPVLLEALLFGQAGLIPENPSEEYSFQLKREHAFLQQKHGLVPIKGSLWKFLRLRPSNFPTIRIAQLADLMNRGDDLFAKLLESTSLQTIRRLFEVRASEFWSTHFMFGKISPKQVKILGPGSVDLLISNFVVPFLIFYGTIKQDYELKEKGVAYLEESRGEQNAEISSWGKLGLPSENAMQTQALLHLKRDYCDRKRCLECRIGNIILNH